MFIYETNCTVANGDDIEAMVDACKEISWKTLVKYVDIHEVADLFPDYNWTAIGLGKGFGIRLKDDHSVRFCKSTYQGRPCYYIEWSGIEYVFTEE